MKQLTLGVSSCLLGDQVRYNGSHSQNHYVLNTLSQFSNFVSACPEVAIGMGIPRETVRLEKGTGTDVIMRAPKSGKDYTEPMISFSNDWVEKLKSKDLDGYILKKNSPSCGVFRVKVWDKGQPMERQGRGLFAKAIMEAFPQLPVEEDGRLSDAPLRERFVTRVFAYRRVKDLFKGEWRRKDVVQFQAREKLLMMAHSPHGAKKVGRLVGEIEQYGREEFKELYITAFMECMNEKASKGRHVNALTHMAGYLKKQMSSEGKQELYKAIDQYREGIVPLVVPVMLLTHFIRRFGEAYLGDQTYLNPCPDQLGLRSYVS